MNAYNHYVGDVRNEDVTALEVVDDEDDDAPPARPLRHRPSLLARLRSRPTWLVGALAVVMGLAAVYTALAVDGVRVIEHQWRESEALSRAYGRRVAQAKEASGADTLDKARLDAALADARAAFLREVRRRARRVEHVVAIDPGVRAVRALVASRIRERAERFAATATDDELYFYDRGTGAVEQALRHQLRRWRLEETRVDEPDLPPPAGF